MAALLCTLALLWTAAAEQPAKGLVTLETVAVLPANLAYVGRPLTVELWARLDAGDHYNILAACELKTSATHWEIFTLPGSGRLAAYLPGANPPQLDTPVSVTDGRWHYLAMVLDGRSVRLFVDATLAGEMAITEPEAPARVPGPLVFGALVDRALSCGGAIRAARLTAAAREITPLPEPPAAADDLTIGLWHFDQAAPGVQIADRSRLGNTAVCERARVSMDRIDITQLTAEEAAELDKANFVPSGPSLAPPPPDVDLAAVRADYDRALRELPLRSLRGAPPPRDGVLFDWSEQFERLERQLSGAQPLPPGAAEQVFDRHALVYRSDGDPLGVVLRRTGALVALLQALPKPPATDGFAADLARLHHPADAAAGDTVARRRLYLLACALRREALFAHPLLDFDSILFVARGNYLGSRITGPRVTADVFGQHFATQYFAFNSIPGGGLFVVRDYRTRPTVRNVLAEARVANGRLKGQRLEPGAFLSPDLSFDGRRILFAYTENREHRWVWSNQTTWNLFSVNTDGSDLRQLTDSPTNDFDPCWLPDGRIAFISERRGGYIRCFALLHVPNYTLCAMNADGSDIELLSFYETSEWHPSVDHQGRIIYTRWDYTDRENCLGSNFWVCYPDGRDPRAPHGNYPYPWHTFADNTQPDSRRGRPYVELNIRAVPGSPLYLLTAAPHHGEAFGSLVMLDLRVPDDGAMSQLRRVTPYEPFPETESPARSQYAYGTAWPLSEDLYLCNQWEHLYLLDRFGNQELVCENALVFGTTNPDFRLIDPIPLRSRPKPPVIPRRTTPPGEDGPPAVIRVVNVYDSDLPFPPGTTIRWLRVVQNFPKTNPHMGVPMIGYQNENTPRMPLGIVPVEADGSVAFEAPAGRELMFQVLDEHHMAVQGMRSVAYVHRGEQLTCAGCHEPSHRASARTATPLAFRRPPSRLAPEVEPVEPITYYRWVRPVFERSCIPCHREAGRGPVDMSYTALEPDAFYFAGGMSGTTTKPIHGGSRTIPGRFGARNSRLGRALLDDTHRGKIATEDFLRVVLWLDANSPRLGAFEDEARQVAGECVWPALE